jgi:hypothetical protein
MKLDIRGYPMLPEEIGHLFTEWRGTGSRFICNPPVMNTDTDFVCLIKGSNSETFETLYRLDYKLMQGNPEYEVLARAETYPFYGGEEGRINLIVCRQPDMYRKWVRATEIATEFNLTERQDRLDLFRIIRNSEVKYV